MQFLRWLSKRGKGGRRHNTHSTYAAKFRKALCFLTDEQVDEDSKEGASITVSPKELGGKYIFVSEPAHAVSSYYIWGQGSDLKLSPSEFCIALTSDLLIPPTSPQAPSYSSNASFCRNSQHRFYGQKVMLRHR